MELKPLELKPIPGYDGMYWASNHGQIFSMKNGNCLEMQLFDHHKRSGPRLSVQLYLNKKRKTFAVHYLVAIAFGKEKKEGDYLVRHWDGNYRNNHEDNLLWGNDQDNADDTKRYNAEYTAEDEAKDAQWI